MKLTDTDIAWVAGLLEGEGCFYSKGSAANVICKKNDKDVIQNLQNKTGVGRVYAYTNGDGKYGYTWKVGRRQEAIDLMKLILPYMGQRRSLKINQILSKFEGMPPPKRSGRPREAKFDAIT